MGVHSNTVFFTLNSLEMAVFSVLRQVEFEQSDNPVRIDKKCVVCLAV